MRVIVIPVLFSILLAGCSTQSMNTFNGVMAEKPTALDKDFGLSVKTMINSQKLDPEVKGSTDVDEQLQSIEGSRAEQIESLYQRQIAP